MFVGGFGEILRPEGEVEVVLWVGGVGELEDGFGAGFVGCGEVVGFWGVGLGWL